jgi:pyruvate/2-oxoglutarate dehydrogenase complex dihydrolipoamide acyltransferase (E2) component
MSSTFTPFRNLSSWRRISLHAWKRPADPTVYGTLEIDMERALRYLRGVRDEIGPHVTVTHLVAKALALAIRQHPKANGIVAWRRIYLRDTVDIFIQVASEEGEELSGAKVAQADAKSVAEIALEVAERVASIRQRRDRDIEGTKRLVSKLPNVLLGPVLRLIEFLLYELGLDLSRFGVVRDGFGSAMVSNVGMFGVTFGLAPLVPFSRAPIVILVGRVQNRPWVEGERLAVRPVLTLGCTFDHRVIDGALAAKLAALVRAVIEDPARYLGDEAALASADPSRHRTAPGVLGH